MAENKVQLILTSIFFVLLLSGCNSDFNYKKTPHSIVVDQDSIRTEITVTDVAIIHVTKQLQNHPATVVPDYVTVLEPQEVDWTVEESTEYLSVVTQKLKVQINKQGEIFYFSKNGQQLLRELKEKTYILADSAASYSVSQSFEGGDEALFGLGQFQSGRMNMKSVPVRLEQCNQEIAVPVLVSTNQYGLYWNNYSVTDFNLPEHEINLNQTIDEGLVIRKTTFTPEKSGSYNFFILSETPFQFHKKGNSNRRLGEVLLTLNNDTVIFYNTMWFPDSFSGEIELEAGKAYEIVFRNTGEQTRGRLMYNEPDFNKTTFASQQGKAIDYYFIHGDNPVEILSGYSRLTGKAPLFPKSSYGFWQCREAYPTQAALLNSAREYRKRKIPVDNIVQDWDYWPKGVKGPEWDRSRYPNPRAMVRKLDKMHLNLMVSVWPTVSHPELCKTYDLEESKLAPTDYIDFFNPDTHQKYYQMLSDSMFQIGVQSIWLDGSEPVFHPNPKSETPVGKFEELSNAYALLVTKAMYEGRRAEFPNERVFNLTRSAFAGQQRYGSCVWSGDVDGSWEQFAEQIPAGLNFAMTGTPYWTTDIGGFFRGEPREKKDYLDQYTNPEFRELLTRWFQYGTFTPLFRIHGFKTETEIWNFGQEFEDIARKFIDLRYQLMPYIYSEAWEVTREGKLLMSPLAYYYPDDKRTWSINDQFFFGKSLIVCPVTEYKVQEREVYMPEGNWYNLWTNEIVSGGRIIIAAAELNSIPIFVKEGSIIPWGPKVQYATQPTDEPIILKIYPGKDAVYTLYFDDNTSYKYEKGKYSEINISYSESDNIVTIENGNGNYLDFKRLPQDFVIEVIGTKRNMDVKYNGEKISFSL